MSAALDEDEKIWAYIWVVNVVPGLFNNEYLEDDSPAVRYNGAVSDNILPIVVIIEVIIGINAIGKTNFQIVCNLVLPNAKEFVLISYGTFFNACSNNLIKDGKITIINVKAPAINELPYFPLEVHPNVWININKPNIPKIIEGVVPRESKKKIIVFFIFLFFEYSFKYIAIIKANGNPIMIHMQITSNVLTSDWNVESFSYKKNKFGLYSIPIIPFTKISPTIHVIKEKHIIIDKISVMIFQ